MATKTLGRPKIYEAEVKACLSEEQISRLQDRAKAERVNRSEIIRRAVDKYLEEK